MRVDYLGLRKRGKEGVRERGEAWVCELRRSGWRMGWGSLLISGSLHQQTFSLLFSTPPFNQNHFSFKNRGPFKQKIIVEEKVFEKERSD